MNPNDKKLFEEKQKKLIQIIQSLRRKYPPSGQSLPTSQSRQHVSNVEQQRNSPTYPHTYEYCHVSTEQYPAVPGSYDNRTTFSPKLSPSPDFAPLPPPSPSHIGCFGAYTPPSDTNMSIREYLHNEYHLHAPPSYSYYPSPGYNPDYVHNLSERFDRMGVVSGYTNMSENERCLISPKIRTILDHAPLDSVETRSDRDLYAKFDTYYGPPPNPDGTPGVRAPPGPIAQELIDAFRTSEDENITAQITTPETTRDPNSENPTNDAHTLTESFEIANGPNVSETSSPVVEITIKSDTTLSLKDTCTTQSVHGVEDAQLYHGYIEQQQSMLSTAPALETAVDTDKEIKANNSKSMKEMKECEDVSSNPVSDDEEIYKMMENWNDLSYGEMIGEIVEMLQDIVRQEEMYKKEEKKVKVFEAKMCQVEEMMFRLQDKIDEATIRTNIVVEAIEEMIEQSEELKKRQGWEEEEGCHTWVEIECKMKEIEKIESIVKMFHCDLSERIEKIDELKSQYELCMERIRLLCDL